MVFHEVTERICMAVGQPGSETRLKYQVAGEAMTYNEKLNLESVCDQNAPAIKLVNARAVAVALAVIAANVVLS